MRTTLGPLLLIAVTLPFPSIIAHACTDSVIGGSGKALLEAVMHDPVGLIIASLRVPTSGAMIALAVHSAWQILLMSFLPGRVYTGPVTAAGETPKYRDHGVFAFFLTICAFFSFSSWNPLVISLLPPALHYSPTIFYTEYVPLLTLLPTGALLLCGALYIKGLTCPSSRDSGSSGNIVTDLFWGTELYPRIAGVDVKQLINCRHALMLWALIPLSFLAHSFEQNSLTLAQIVNTLLQCVYVFKFFLWESGYMASMDIAHDRAGYYLCWGCMAFVPSMYLVHSWWLVTAIDRAVAVNIYFPDLSPASALGILLAGLIAIALNYDADRQRQAVRSGTSKTVWGRKPVIVRAPYTTESGERRESILLASGYWGIARHWHYVPEIAAAFFWTLPVRSASSLPYMYVAFLTILLIDRAFRDDARCAAKYGVKWEEYKKLVPYKIIPGIL
jgi:7-dehydrocholesterol reductase